MHQFIGQHIVYGVYRPHVRHAVWVGGRDAEEALQRRVATGELSHVYRAQLERARAQREAAAAEEAGAVQFLRVGGPIITHLALTGRTHKPLGALLC